MWSASCVRISLLRFSDSCTAGSRRCGATCESSLLSSADSPARSRERETPLLSVSAPHLSPHSLRVRSSAISRAHAARLDAILPAAPQVGE